MKQLQIMHVMRATCMAITLVTAYEAFMSLEAGDTYYAGLFGILCLWNWRACINLTRMIRALRAKNETNIQH